MTSIRVAAPVAGWLTSLDRVPDEVFAQGMLGAGIAIDPVEGVVTAPCAATVALVAPTRHAVTLRTDAGAELVIHVGLETVALDGRGFEAHVEAGARVAAGDRLLSFDMDSVGLEAKSLVTPVILTDDPHFRFVTDESGRMVGRGDPIGTIEAIEQERRAEIETGPTQSAECVVGLEHGLHARPAARIVECVKRLGAEVVLEARGRSASGRSAVAIMALDARKSDRVAIHARGPDGAAVIEALSALIEGPGATPAATPAAVAAGDAIAGTCAMAGVAVGTAVQWRRALPEPAEHGEDAAREHDSLARAIAQVRARLQGLGDEATGPGREVARAHLTLLEDEEVMGAAEALIGRGKSAGYAWRAAAADAGRALAATGNPMMRERVADLDDIAGQVLRALHGDDSESRVELPEQAILLADELLPSELLALDRGRIAGIGIGRAGPTSHVAIIAASFGVPTLVGMGPGLSQVADGTRVLLDATAGRLVIDPPLEAESAALAPTAFAWSDAAECATADGQRVTLLANLGSLAEVEAALARGAEGCGLLRTEFLFLDRGDAPGEDEQIRAYQAIADALGERPLTIRTLDIGGDKPVPFLDLAKEANPALGMRGIRIGLARPDLLDAQLRAIAQVRSPAGIKAMIPMVSSLGELRAVRSRMADLAEGRKVRVGVMVETPAAVAIADELARDSDFLSIGSNDLAQYTLAMDRTNPALAASVDALHPAVLRLIAMTVEAAKRHATPVSLCGGLASDPLGAILLVGLGIRELSAVPAALPAVRGAIAAVSVDECRRLAEHALAAGSAAEVRKLAAELLSARFTEGGLE